MNTFECFIKNSILIDDKEFYLIQEKESKEEHYIPINQIDIFNDLDKNKSYEFVKAKNFF